jgi:DNA-binding NarL/FixJ family response regulator
MAPGRARLGRGRRCRRRARRHRRRVPSQRGPSWSQLALLVFSQWVELTYARQLLAAGPSRTGYLLKDRILTSADFVDAIRRIHDGGTALDPDVVQQLFAEPGTDGRLLRLTARERNIFARLAEGRTNQAIADVEHLAVRSVEKVIASIFLKLDLLDNGADHRRVLAVLHYLETQRADKTTRA